MISSLSSTTARRTLASRKFAFQLSSAGKQNNVNRQHQFLSRTKTTTTTTLKTNNNSVFSSYAAGSGAVLVTFAAVSYCYNNGDSYNMLAEAAKNNNPIFKLFGDAQDTTKNSDSATSCEAAASGEEDTCDGGPGKKVKVDLEPELVESLPVMTLEEVRTCNGMKSSKRLLVSYDGIVYDITEFIQHHPGGQELAKTAAGLDLEFFFANYIIHGNSDKAAQWLAPLAVGKLSKEDALKSKVETNAIVHETKRMKMLGKKRRNILVVVSSLPFWISVRSCVSFIGWFIPPLGRFLANWFVPIPVPGLSLGTERLLAEDEGKTSGTITECEGGTCEMKPGKKPYSVAVIGGGIAGCGAGWALAQSGQFDVTVYEARAHISGNAKTFDWDFAKYGKEMVRSCVSVTAWPTIFYKNYTCLLEQLGVETVPMPLSWFLHSKVPGYEGILWEADPSETYDTYYPTESAGDNANKTKCDTAFEETKSLREVFKRDFQRYSAVVNFTQFTVNLFSLKWTPLHWNDTASMYDSLDGLNALNPLNLIPLYSCYKFLGGSDEWWDIVFTPQYTASFLVDNLRPFPAVLGPKIEQQIPLLPNKTNTWNGKSELRGDHDCNITTCVTWKDGGFGLQKVFEKLTKDVTVNLNTRVLSVEVLDNGKKRVTDEYNNAIDVDRVIFACPANAVGNMIITPNSAETKQKKHTYGFYNRFLMDSILSTPVYADDHHPDAGHTHAIMHSDSSIIDPKYRKDVLARASNHVEITATPGEEEKGSKTKYHIENNYNFGVQTPGLGVYDLPLNEKPVMLISHTLGDNKQVDESKILGTGHHARAHPLYSGWNIMTHFTLRLLQGKYGIYYCSNWTTPGNTHDYSLLSGFVTAYACGAKYPFESNVEAKKDFNRMRKYMGV